MGFFDRHKKEIEEIPAEDGELDIINLDDTAGWSKLDVAEALAEQQAINLMEEIGDELKNIDMEEDDLAEFDMTEDAAAGFDMTEDAAAEFDTAEVAAVEYAAAEFNMTEVAAVEYAATEFDMAEVAAVEYVAAEFDMAKGLAVKEEAAEGGAAESDMIEIAAVEYDVAEGSAVEEDVAEEDMEYFSVNDEDEYEDYEEESSFVFFENVTAWFSRWTVMDKIVTATGILVLAVAILTAGMYAGSRGLQKQIEAFAPVGEQLETVGVVSQDKLVAVADAKKAMLEAAKLEAELNQTYEESEISNEVKVIMKMTSVQRDLKIKFVNKKNGKLVGNVPFEVKITDAENKTYHKIDEDKDGIIYLTKIVPGNYEVSMVELDDMGEYSFSTSKETIKVKENIAYEKIDVSDEIKNQSEVDVSREDTAKKTETEGALTDTVEWVESSKTENSSDETYTEVDKETIADPALSASLNPDLGVLQIMRQSMLASSVLLQSDTVSDNNIIIAVTGVALNKTELHLKNGESETLTATVTPENAANRNVMWTTSDESVATVDANGVVKAVSAGTADITVTTADGNKTSVCKVTIEAVYDPKNDTTNTLKDKSGNQIYVLVDEQYVEAKVADYYTHTKFYKKEEVSQYTYTGWQDLDGKTYYYDKNGIKVTGEQVIQGAKYSFNSDGSLNTGSGILGIDVSTWNGNIDWNKVKSSGVSYVIIRTGFRGSTQGALVEDNKFRQNIQGASNAGLKVGVYFFSQAVNEVEAVEEASMVLSQVKGYRLSYPVFIDVEPSGGRADSLSSGERTKVINAFCQTIQNGGYSAGIYANKTWLSQKMNISALSGYKIWLAQYNSEVTYSGRYDIWQYSEKGSVSGISGKVDMNLSYLTY